MYFIQLEFVSRPSRIFLKQTLWICISFRIWREFWLFL